MNEQPHWRITLRETRKALGLDQKQLADRVGVSRESIRAYESGRRKPPRQPLDQIVDALKMPNEIANAIREALGYTPVRSPWVAEFAHGYFFSRDELPAHIALQPWPEFVTNDAMEVVAANPACEAIWDIDFAAERAARGRAQMNLLSVASDHHFADRVVNWEEVIAVMVGALKGAALTLENNHAYLGEVMAEFAKGDPAFLARLLKVYERTEAPAPKVRWTYPVTWRIDAFGEMRFLATVSNASEPDAFAFNSWLPIDAASWTVLDAVKAARQPAGTP